MARNTDKASMDYVNSKNMDAGSEPYIHLKKTSYIKDRKGTLPTSSLIFANYMEQASFLENEAFKNFKTNNPEKIKTVMDAQKEVMEKMENEKAFQEIGKILSETLLQVEIGGKGVGGISGVEKMKKALDDTADFLNGVNEIVELFNKVDYLLLQFLDKENTTTMDINKGNLFVLSDPGVKEARLHFEKIYEVKKQLENGAGADSILGITKSLAADINKAKGGVQEIVSAMIAKALYTDLFAELKSDSIMTVETMGEEKMYIDRADSRWDTISKISRSKTSTYGGFRSKSDTVHVIYDVDANGNSAEIGFVGNSIKSYKYETAIGKSIVDSSPWANVFTFADLVGTYFEYNYANMLIHEQTRVNESSKMMNRYLASRAASFMISGVTGIGKGGAGSAPALFMTYSNKVMYIPDILRDIAAKKSPEFKLSTSAVPTLDNTPVRATSRTSPEIAAYKRSKKLMAKIRRSVKFAGKR